MYAIPGIYEYLHAGRSRQRQNPRDGKAGQQAFEDTVVDFTHPISWKTTTRARITCEEPTSKQGTKSSVDENVSSSYGEPSI